MGRKNLVRWVKSVAGWLNNRMSQVQAQGEQSVEQQDSKLRSLKFAIGRIGLHVNSNAALNKLQKEEKAMEKQLTHLRRVDMHVHVGHAALRKGEKIVISKEMTAVK